MNSTGWYVNWKDGAMSLVVTFQAGDDGLVPMVLAEDKKTIVPASDLGDYTLEHPNELTRGF